ncbi:MAG: hypothetical protein V7641_4908 [Blastocatellia bacterium]
MVLSAKFCRQCGNRFDASEMTTRSLDAPSAEPPPYDNPTRPANAGITSPTYAPPAMMQPQPPPYIGSQPPSSNKTAFIVILGIVLTMLIGLGIVAFVVLGRFSSGPVPPPPPPGMTGQSGQGPSGSGIPAPPPPPGVPPPPPPPGDVKNPFDPALIYPGAKTVMSVNSKDGRVAQLATSDPFNKVADWYAEKIHAIEDTILPGSRILKGKGITVILAGTGDGTSITLTDEKD